MNTTLSTPNTRVDPAQRRELWAMLQRCHAIGQRNADTICQHIQTCNDLSSLDRLFDFGERQHALYLRIYARYDALCGELEG